MVHGSMHTDQIDYLEGTYSKVKVVQGSRFERTVALIWRGINTPASSRTVSGMYL